LCRETMAVSNGDGCLWLRGNEQQALAHIPDAVGLVIMHWPMGLEIRQQWPRWEGIRDVCPQVDASEQPAQLAGEATAGDVDHTVELDPGLPVQATQHVDNRGGIEARGLQGQGSQCSLAVRHRMPGSTMLSLENKAKQGVAVRATAGLC